MNDISNLSTILGVVSTCLSIFIIIKKPWSDSREWKRQMEQEVALLRAENIDIKDKLSDDYHNFEKQQNINALILEMLMVLGENEADESGKHIDELKDCSNRIRKELFRAYDGRARK